MSTSAKSLGEIVNTSELSDFDQIAGGEDRPGLFSADALSVMQVNIGLRCNLSCSHCHVNSSPHRKEEMTWETMGRVLAVAGELECETVDITGGAPEMHPHFRRFAMAAREAGHSVIVRTNLTILLQPGYEDMPTFFREQHVRLVASLPCYLEDNVDRQRGDGVYRESVRAIQRLNRIGYGIDPSLELTLIYNPMGSSLPPDQKGLEEEYRKELRERFGIAFTRLHTITNIPIGRFRAYLKGQGLLDDYQETLKNAYNPDTVEHLMCRRQVSVGWDGALYDCDFNYALRLPMVLSRKATIDDADIQELLKRKICTGDHCYACVAGAGSSCGGTLV